MMFRSLLVVSLVSLLGLNGCSIFMEASRPSPVDLSQFTAGESHQQVLEELGPPAGTLVDSDGAQCDTYHLYTHGYGAATKVAIATGEAAADVFTLCLTELVFTPFEMATENSQHPVVFCYQSDRLVRLHASQNSAAQNSAVNFTEPQLEPADPAEAQMQSPGPAPSVATPRVAEQQKTDSNSVRHDLDRDDVGWSEVPLD